MTRSSFRLMLVVLPRILIVAPDGPHRELGETFTGRVQTESDSVHFHVSPLPDDARRPPRRQPPMEYDGLP